ncbi:GNAT family N-acetyltransferase [Scopulibacillus cellulosilyticus]|uniref:GNAT family N-acetyltransferase n=1 Tax=Scopulibacillus cellulosilyticus TaxID=2665665 RepID=A0ABW2Q4E1_9BACL
MDQLNSKNLFSGDLVRLAAKRHEDALIMFKWQEDSDYLRRMDSDFAAFSTLEELEERDRQSNRQNGPIEFRIRTLEDDRLVGFVALFGIEWNNQSAKLAIGIGDSKDRGKGYGTEALKLILGYAFNELNLYRVGLDVNSYNISAIKAYKKAGFIEEGKMRDSVYRDGCRYSRIMMSILKDEWM